MSDFAPLPVIWRDIVVPIVVRQHAEEAAVLWQLRAAAVGRANFSLMYLERFDRRLEAHLDALAVAGNAAWSACLSELENASPGSLFAAAHVAIRDHRQMELRHLFGLAMSIPETLVGLLSAFGWHDRAQLRGIVAELLDSREPFERMVGVAVCAMHRVDPGLASGRWIDDADPLPRARALRAAGELGKFECLSVVRSSLDDVDETCRFWAGWSAVLLGDRGRALEVLSQFALSEGPLGRRATQLMLQAATRERGHELLHQFNADPTCRRALVQGAGVVGDPTYVPWLIAQMADDKLARLAGESFCLIAGVDLSLAGLDRKPPTAVVTGPTEDASDSDVDMDDDEGLPWPDAERVSLWWKSHSTRFEQSSRWFMGSTPSAEHCADVLATAYQRQRILAAQYLALSAPQRSLFNTSAPARHQRAALRRH